MEPITVPVYFRTESSECDIGRRIDVPFDHDCAIEQNGGGTHDEGFNYWTELIWRDGDTVYMSAESNSSDCDGPLSTSDSFKWNEADQVWERTGGDRRDAFAEQMNY
jgi:hypothetical protein